MHCVSASIWALGQCYFNHESDVYLLWRTTKAARLFEQAPHSGSEYLISGPRKEWIQYKNKGSEGFVLRAARGLDW